jgi:hypothetical protein
MCGIFGLIAKDASGPAGKVIQRGLPKLLKLSESRGREAAGVAIAAGGSISLYKEATRASAMLKSSEFAQFIRDAVALRSSGAYGAAKSIAAIGNTRLVTNGSQAIVENNQPIRAGHIVGVHNGIITNDRELSARHASIADSTVSFSDSDTRVLMGLVNKYYEEAGDIRRAIASAYREIHGSASIALLLDDAPVLALATNTGSLFYSYSEEDGLFVFGSERYIVEAFLNNRIVPCPERFHAVRSVDPFSGIRVDFNRLVPVDFGLNETPRFEPPEVSGRPGNRWAVVDISASAAALRRCTKCVLPETYPFIAFDEEGVCNYCRKYRKQKFLGSEALEAFLAPYRSNDGSPDCIVGFSGGRDSSYGLHVLKKEFGMHPIAYTYDWAMVTDLARRNQAKVTGKLGVEHIIRAADIHTKRRYIRKNIYAWLKKPELGMVPLFMAGDKMFYYYGRQLRRETGIKLTVFASGQQLEQMEFKIGFCGIDQDLVNNTRLYHYDLMVKTRLAAWYIKQYLLNPSYINESLIDSIFAFYSSFINKDDYLYLYHYLPWDEKAIEKTLKEEYEWETDEKYGKNQWRMGDGHTAFIDYIYHTVGGFSEFDNFRSNQIREGLISRAEAMALIEEDNKPRVQMLQDFSQLIGFNLEEVLLRINAIPKLYEHTKKGRAASV